MGFEFEFTSSLTLFWEVVFFFFSSSNLMSDEWLSSCCEASDHRLITYPDCTPSTPHLAHDGHPFTGSQTHPASWLHSIEPHPPPSSNCWGESQWWSRFDLQPSSQTSLQTPSHPAKTSNKPSISDLGLDPLSSFHHISPRFAIYTFIFMFFQRPNYLANLQRVDGLPFNPITVLWSQHPNTKPCPSWLPTPNSCMLLPICLSYLTLRVWLVLAHYWAIWGRFLVVVRVWLKRQKLFLNFRIWLNHTCITRRSDTRFIQQNFGCWIKILESKKKQCLVPPN